MGTRRLNAIWVLIAAVTITAAGCDTGSSGGGSGSAPAPGNAPVAGSTPTATQPAVAREERPVVAESLPYAEVDEQLVHGYFAFPEDMVDPLPGIIVIHERWGLDPGTRGLAERLAAQGYIVLAVDLFGGKTTTDVGVARTMMLPVLENPDVANENIRQAYRFLAETAGAPSIAALGWSFGGNWALNTALLFPDELDAAIIYYGQVTNNEEKLRPMNVPVLGLFGANDRGVTVATVREFEAVMQTLGKEHEIEIYDGVGHAFADPTGSNYNPAVAEQAWSKVLAFLDEHLGQEAD
jgi:carboxymethylenebutenolidase